MIANEINVKSMHLNQTNGQCQEYPRDTETLVSSGFNLTSRGEGTSLPLVGHLPKDSVAIKISYEVDVLLYPPALHLIFSY